MALEQRHPVLKDFGVFGSRLREVFGMSVSALEAGGQEEVQKKGRKKEIIEDKNSYNSKIFDFTNKQLFRLNKFYPSGAKFFSPKQTEKNKKEKRNWTLPVLKTKSYV